MKSRIIFSLSFLIQLLFLIENSAFSQNWPMLNLNKERTSWVSNENVLYPPLQKKGEYKLKSVGSAVSEISCFNNLLCISSQNNPNILEAYDIEKEDTLWTFQVPGSMASMSFMCAQNDSLVFAGGQQGLGLYALNRETGKEKWSKPIGNLYTRNIILDGNYGYIMGDSLYCLNVSDGATVWTNNINFQGTPAVDDKYVYLVGKNKISILDKIKGNLVWEKYNSQQTSGGITVDDSCFFTFSNDTIFAYFKDTREIKWTYLKPGDTILNTTQNTFAITDNKLFLTIRHNSAGNGQLVTLDKATGNYLWERTFIGELVFTPVIANQVVYVVPYNEKTLYGFNIENGGQVFFDNTSSYQYQPIIANHRLYVRSTRKVVVFGNVETLINKINNFPQSFELQQNYPNPFNADTQITFTLHEPGKVNLKIFDTTGREIQKIIDTNKSAGTFSVKINTLHIPSGIYFYQLQCNGIIQTRKMVLVK